MRLLVLFLTALYWLANTQVRAEVPVGDRFMARAMKEFTAKTYPAYSRTCIPALRQYLRAVLAPRGDAVGLVRMRMATKRTCNDRHLEADLFTLAERPPRRRTVATAHLVVAKVGYPCCPGLNPVGYVHVRAFSLRAEREISAALGEFNEVMANARFLIIDLRHNLGGLTTAGAKFLELFSPQGNTLAFVIRTRAGPVPYFTYAERSVVAKKDYPILVLVDDWTASMAEAIVRVLRSWYPGRVTVMGAPTFGKEVVVNYTPLVEERERLMLIVQHRAGIIVVPGQPHGKIVPDVALPEAVGVPTGLPSSDELLTIAVRRFALRQGGQKATR